MSVINTYGLREQIKIVDVLVHCEEILDVKIKTKDHFFIRLVSLIVTVVMIMPIKDFTISMIRFALGMFIMVSIAIWFFINSKKDFDKINSDKDKND